MANVSVTIPDAQINRVTDAFAARYGWKDVPTSGTKAAFTKARVQDFVRQTVQDHESQVAQDAARAKVVVEVPLT